MCKVVNNSLASHKCTVIDHPPYSPDFAHIDFYLFGNMRWAFKNDIFLSCEQIISKIKFFCTGISTGQYKSVHKEWLSCAHKLSESDRSYCL